jgi:hypothetical protein
VEEISSKFCKFFKREKLFFKCEKLFFKFFFESIKFQGESVWKKVLRFIESLRCVKERSLSLREGFEFARIQRK